MKLIDADEIAYESIDSSDTAEYFAKYGTGILAVRKEDIDAMPTIADCFDLLIPVTKEEVLRAGLEGREVKFRLGGRRFAIRELAQ